VSKIGMGTLFIVMFSVLATTDANARHRRHNYFNGPCYPENTCSGKRICKFSGSPPRLQWAIAKSGECGVP